MWGQHVIGLVTLGDWAEHKPFSAPLSIVHLSARKDGMLWLFPHCWDPIFFPSVAPAPLTLAFLLPVPDGPPPCISYWHQILTVEDLVILWGSPGLLQWGTQPRLGFFMLSPLQLSHGGALTSPPPLPLWSLS